MSEQVGPYLIGLAAMVAVLSYVYRLRSLSVEERQAEIRAGLHRARPFAEAWAVRHLPIWLVAVCGLGALGFQGAHFAGYGPGLGGVGTIFSKKGRAGYPPPSGCTYTAPNKPTIDAVVFAPSGDSVRLLGSAFAGSCDDTHDSTNFQVDTINGNWSSPKFQSTLGAVLTDTATGLDSAGHYKARVRYKGDDLKSATWSSYSDSVDFVMVFGSVPNPSALPTMLTGNPINPTWSEFSTLALGGRSEGYSYNDPTSDALVTKLTDDDTPYSGGLGFGSMYSDGGTYISHPWGASQDSFTIVIFQGDDTRTWLVDYKLGGTVGNYRELTGSLQPATDLAFCFSSDSSTPQIAYVANGTNIVRINTAGTPALANTGNFPHAATATGTYWLGCDKNDDRFVWLKTATQACAWDESANNEDCQTWASINEPRLERAGRWVMLAAQPSYKLWDLNEDTVSTTTYNNGPMAHNASLENYFVATDWDNGGYNRMNPVNGGFTDVSTKMCFDGGETHLSGAWVGQGGGTDQWFVATSQGDGGWSNSTYVLGHFAVCIVRADGSEARLVAHTGSNTSTDYWSLPFANISPSGHLVIWTSRHSTNGTNANNDYSLMVAEIPRS